MPTTGEHEFMKLPKPLSEEELTLHPNWHDILSTFLPLGIYSNPVELHLKESGPLTDSGPQLRGKAKMHGVG